MGRPLGAWHCPAHSALDAQFVPTHWRPPSQVDEHNKIAKVGKHEIKEGDWISINGTTGESPTPSCCSYLTYMAVLLGRHPCMEDCPVAPG